MAIGELALHDYFDESGSAEDHRTGTRRERAAGEASPAEGSMSGAGPQETYNPFKGWARAPLTLILVLVVLVAAFFLAYALVLLL